MGVMDRFRTKDESPKTEYIGLEEVMDNFDIQYVNDEPGHQFAVVTAKKLQNQRSEVLPGEWGSTSASPWTSFTRQEYNPAVRGLKGLEMYDKMRRSDGGVRSTLRAAKTPVLAARWFVEPGGDKDIDKKAAKWVECNLFDPDYMITPWFQTLTEALLMLDFGYYMFEQVWENRVINGEMRTVLKKLAPRHPMDVKTWNFDINGGPNSVTMYRDQMAIEAPDVEIPIEKMLVFTFDKEAGNIEGISILRSAYKHWYYKEQLYKIDAIQKERHGIGIPLIKLPLGFSDADKVAAENLGRNVRTNERAHIVLPPGWDIMMLKLEGQPVDCLKSVDHHDSMIRQNILGEFLGGNGKEEDQTMFLKATRFIADITAETFNSYCIPQMVQYNFAHAAIPKLRARRIGEQEDQRTLSFTVRNAVGSGIIVPDDVLEAAMRDALDLPAADPSTARPQTGSDIFEFEAKLAQEEVNANPDDNAAKVGISYVTKNPPATPGGQPNKSGPSNGGTAAAGGARVGLPRQAAAGKQRKGQGPGRAGTDKSGGN